MGEFMKWEIQEALDQMVPLKKPSPDGMPPLFYQHFWGIMKSEVTSTILDWLNAGKLPYPIIDWLNASIISKYVSNFLKK